MRLRSKEINIFNMSALDLFASALGAFILISVVLFPYFPNTGDSQERVDEVKAELEQAALDSCQAQQRAAASAGSALGACESRNQQMQQELQSCEQQLRKKFVLIVISWSTGDDVDLHVIDPAGREFYYEKKFHSGSRAKLEEDNTRGPGNEIWLHPAAEPGRYKVYFKYYGGSGNSVPVRGAVLTPRGRTELPRATLRRVGEKPWIATIEVDSEGNADVRAR